MADRWALGRLAATARRFHVERELDYCYLDCREGSGTRLLGTVPPVEHSLVIDDRETRPRAIALIQEWREAAVLAHGVECHLAGVLAWPDSSVERSVRSRYRAGRVAAHTGLPQQGCHWWSQDVRLERAPAARVGADRDVGARGRGRTRSGAELVTYGLTQQRVKVSRGTRARWLAGGRQRPGNGPTKRTLAAVRQVLAGSTQDRSNEP
jgi:hypothetical protein